MLKWILITIAVVIIGGCTAVVGGIYWAYSSVQATPDFYEQVEQVELSEEVRSEKIDEVLELAQTVVPTVSFEPESDDSVQSSEDDVPTDTEPELTVADNAAVDGEKDASPLRSAEPRPVHIEFDERTLNTYVTALFDEYTTGREPFSDPRIQLRDDIARIGFRLKTPEFRGVVSVDVRPRVESAKTISLEFHRIALGNLGIPLEQALTSANINTKDLPEGISIPPNSKPPRVVLSWDHLDEIATEVESATIGKGALSLDFTVAEPSTPEPMAAESE